MELGNPINEENLEELIDALFVDHPVIYEAYSQPDHELRKFESKQEVLSYIKEVKGRKDNLVYLSIHYPGTNGYVRKKIIDLKPENAMGLQQDSLLRDGGLFNFSYG